MYTGAGTRAVIAVSFIAGSVTLLHAMRSRDTLLLRTCVLGNAAFAFSMLVMIVVAYAALPDRDELLDTTCSFTYQQLDTTCVWAYVTLLFSVMAVIVFLWYALVCMMLWRDYTQVEESRLKPGVGDAPALHHARRHAELGGHLVELRAADGKRIDRSPRFKETAVRAGAAATFCTGTTTSTYWSLRRLTGPLEVTLLADPPDSISLSDKLVLLETRSVALPVED
jgi:hypothetical protein